MLFVASFGLFVLFFFHPSIVYQGASEGLLLWFHTVLPTLFPFFVLTSLLITSNVLFHIKKPALIAIIGGFTCGYPMGSKIIADLWHKKSISTHEAKYLLSFCNNASPMFISSYFIIQCLNMPKLILPSITILFFSPVLCSILFRVFYAIKDDSEVAKTISFLPQNSSSIEAFDYAITSSMENIVKIGGYIIFFSILFRFGNQYLGDSTLFRYFVVPSLEITSGLKSLSEYNLFFVQKYILMMAHLSFGGICAIFQTKCVLADTPISLPVYTIEKLITALVTSLLSYLYITILY